MWQGKENSTPNVKKESTSTTPRKFPHPPSVITTPIKHFFKASTSAPKATTPTKMSIGTPGKMSIGTPAKHSFGSSPKGVKGVISPRTKTPIKSPKTPKTADYEERAPLSVKSPEGEVRMPSSACSATLEYYEKYCNPNRNTPKKKDLNELQKEFKSMVQQEVVARESIVVPRESILPTRESIVAPPKEISPNRKRDVTEMQREWRTNVHQQICDRGETLERLSITPKKKEIKLMQEGWANMVDEVQVKSDMLENAQDRVEKLEEKVDNTKRENFMLRDEIKDKNQEVIKLAHQLEETRAEMAQLLEERKMREVQIDMLRSDISTINEDDLRLVQLDEVETLRIELELSRAENEKLARKLTERNAELKLYKVKVDHFFGAIDSRPRSKRVSNAGGVDGEHKKRRSSRTNGNR